MQSVNSLGNIYPYDIIEWLEISEKEAKEIIDVLHTQRLILYKFRIKCNCDELCTVYESKLIREKTFYCDVCGQKFSLEDIQNKADIIYEIDKEELLNMGNEAVEFKSVLDVKGKVVPILQKKETKVMDTQEIFIGSSLEAIEYMDQIALKLEKMGEKPLLWNDESKDIFIPGTSTLDSLIKIVCRVKAAIFIFNADDKIWLGGDKNITNESENTVRDNVLFEYGLFMGKLGKGKVCFVCKGKPHIASDLKGITYIDGDDGDTQVKMKLKSWVGALND